MSLIIDFLKCNFGFILIFIIPAILIYSILKVCEMYDFSVMPYHTKEYNKKTLEFKFPRIERGEKRNRYYSWNVIDPDAKDDEG